MADDELERINELRALKRTRLRIIERQVAQFGEQYAPAHLLTERAELRETLAKYETVLGSAIPSGVGDDLGASGRFILSMEEFKNVKDTQALFGYQFGEFVIEVREFIAETNVYRQSHAVEHAGQRRWLIAAVIVLFLIAAFILGRLI
jgi:hypothetical protein